MKLVRQPPNSNCCGQACIATIFGVTLDEAIVAVGTTGKTSTRNLIDAVLALQSVGHHNWTCGSSLNRTKSNPLPEKGTAICKFRLPASLEIGAPRSHWVVYNNGKYYDPAAGVFRQVPDYLAKSKLTSWLPFYNTSDVKPATKDYIDYPENRDKLVEAFGTVVNTPEFKTSAAIGKQALGAA